MILFAFVIFIGATMQFAFKKYPFLKDSVNLIDSDKMYFKIDVNTASVDELVSIPYIGEYTARNIIEFRTKHGPFNDIKKLKLVKGIRDKNYAHFSKYVTVNKP